MRTSDELLVKPGLAIFIQATITLSGVRLWCRAGA